MKNDLIPLRRAGSGARRLTASASRSRKVRTLSNDVSSHIHTVVLTSQLWPHLSSYIYFFPSLSIRMAIIDTNKNRALRVCGVGKISLEEVPIDLSGGLPGDHVLLRIRATGICGSDVRLAYPSSF